ncbi:hypothetical protein COO60DRAFT_1195720 [Scenedesmus sp. NREL 46B-D3]|nr:hypothetical protein COO60DRAFT_1195720 [Scenedesmus sp. NREL 46B-D3]
MLQFWRWWWWWWWGADWTVSMGSRLCWARNAVAGFHMGMHVCGGGDALASNVLQSALSKDDMPFSCCICFACSAVGSHMLQLPFCYVVLLHVLMRDLVRAKDVTQLTCGLKRDLSTYGCSCTVGICMNLTAGASLSCQGAATYLALPCCPCGCSHGSCCKMACAGGALLQWCF